MKILLVTHYFAEHGGGIEIVARALAETLGEKHGMDIRWVASDTEEPRASRSPGLHFSPMPANNAAEKAVGVPYPLWKLSSIPKLWHWVDEADAIHLHDFHYAGNLWVFVFARVKRRPVLLTQHVGLIPFSNPLLRAAQKLSAHTLGRAVLGRAERTIFISEEVRTYFRSFVHFSKAPGFIPNGVDVSSFRPVSKEASLAIRRKLELPTDRPIFLFVGRFVEKKGLHILERLARGLPRVQWLFAGWGELDPERWGLSNVRVLRGLRGVAIAELYQCADLLVLPSVGEGFPLAVQEALACGTPAMVSQATARARPDLEALLFSEAVPPGSAQLETVTERWRYRLRQLADDPQLLLATRQKIDQEGSAWSWEDCADEYARALEAIIPN